MPNPRNCLECDKHRVRPPYPLETFDIIDCAYNPLRAELVKAYERSQKPRRIRPPSWCPKGEQP